MKAWYCTLPFKIRQVAVPMADLLGMMNKLGAYLLSWQTHVGHAKIPNCTCRSEIQMGPQGQEGGTGPAVRSPPFGTRERTARPLCGIRRRRRSSEPESQHCEVSSKTLVPPGREGEGEGERWGEREGEGESGGEREGGGTRCSPAQQRGMVTLQLLHQNLCYSTCATSVQLHEFELRGSKPAFQVA